MEHMAILLSSWNLPWGCSNTYYQSPLDVWWPQQSSSALWESTIPTWKKSQPNHSRHCSRGCLWYKQLGTSEQFSDQCRRSPEQGGKLWRLQVTLQVSNVSDPGLKLEQSTQNEKGSLVLHKATTGLGDASLSTESNLALIKVFR